jgi:hypothetical protein
VQWEVAEYLAHLQQLATAAQAAAKAAAAQAAAAASSSLSKCGMVLHMCSVALLLDVQSAQFMLACCASFGML